MTLTMKRVATLILALTPLALAPAPAVALTMAEFGAICRSAEVPCADHPALNAYVGGALDLIAALDEDTDYLQPLYCRDPREFFDVPAIIRFMEGHEASYRDRNAMLLVIRYLEEFGGCPGHQRR